MNYYRIQTVLGAVLFAIVLCLTSVLTSAQASVSGNGGLNRRLNGMLYTISNHFGAAVTVVSGCRSYAHNRRIGGARESWHLRCMAADFRVKGVSPGSVYQYAKSLRGRGGVGSYCHDSFIHLDVGDRREWHWGCHGERRFSSVKGSYNHIGYWHAHGHHSWKKKSHKHHSHKHGGHKHRGQKHHHAHHHGRH